MASQKITFDNKTNFRELAVPIINKVRDVDINQIKTVVNANADLLDTTKQTADAAETPSGAQSKANAALSAANGYTDTEVAGAIVAANEYTDEQVELLRLELPNIPPELGNKIISGGGFEVGNPPNEYIFTLIENVVFQINNVIYTLSESEGISVSPLPPAGQSRIDVIFYFFDSISNSANIGVVQGIPSVSNPAKPNVPPNVIEATILVVTNAGVTEEIPPIPTDLATQSFVLQAIVDQILAGTNVSIVTDPITLKRTINVTASGGGGTWGSITGTLSAQLDLQAALDLKANLATLGALAFLNQVNTAEIVNNAVTLAKLQEIATGHWLARINAGSGAVESISTAQAKTELDLPNDTVSELAGKVDKTETRLEITANRNTLETDANLVLFTNSASTLELTLTNDLPLNQPVKLFRQGAGRFRILRGAATIVGYTTDLEIVFTGGNVLLTRIGSNLYTISGAV